MVGRKKKIKKSGKIFGIFGSTSGAGAIAGAHNVCHALCAAAVSTLAIVGITISSTSLMFLEDLAPYFWLIGMVFFATSLLLFYLKKQGSRKLLLLNLGILIAGIPFAPINEYQALLWISGGIFMTSSLIMYINERRLKR